MLQYHYSKYILSDQMVIFMVLGCKAGRMIE